MAKDLGETIGTALGRVAHDTVQTIVDKNRKRSSGSLGGMKGLAAGAGLAALAPLAAKGAGRLLNGGLVRAPVKKAGEKVTEAGEKVTGGVKGAVGKSIDEAGGAAGIATDMAKEKLPGGGGKSAGVEGVGKGRRMPIQQAVDVGVPVSTAYNQWTQFEEWPTFMHRLDNVSQEDETHVAFKVKIWGKSKDFRAEILEQRPDERIKWRVAEGVTHSGVATFHELAPRLTRIEVNLDIEPGSLIEKAGRGMRHVKRAVRADLARFKAYVMMKDDESGAWRGEIDDGDVKSKAGDSESGSSSGGRSRASSGRARASSSGARGESGSRRTSGSANGRSRAASGSSSRSSKDSGGSSAKSPSRRTSRARS